ncbi:MAG: hypothetical protein HYX69_15490 [Planctomycetia bacterium]|nr:hypothetical protein [Planctomycetia bacterium]
MDEQQTQPASGDAPAILPAREGRERVHTLAAAQRQRLSELEQQIVAQLDQVTHALASERETFVAGRTDVELRSSEIERRAGELAAREADLDKRRGELEAQREASSRQQAEAAGQLAARQAEVEARAQETDAASARLRQEQRTLAALQEEHQADKEELARLRRRVEEKLTLLEHEHTELAEEQARTRAQRKRIAEQLARERESQRQEANQRLAQIETLAQGEQSGLETLLADARAECEQLSERLRHRGDELSAELAAGEAARGELARVKSRLDQSGHEQQESDAREAELSEKLRATQSRIAALEQELDDARRELAQQTTVAAGATDTDARVRDLTAQRDELARRLEKAEHAAAEASKSAAGEEDAARQRELVDLKQRYEMAVNDIRELRKQNADLERRSAANARAAGVPGLSMDWETQKQRLLASLEEDDGDEEHKVERLQMQDVVRTTDAIVREKESEIDELKRRIDEHGGGPSAASVAAARIEDVFDKDEVVHRERERLKQLETEWENKLRQAEIELSVQRAQVARARAELDEKQRAFDEQLAQQPVGPSSSEPGGKTKKQPRGKWLARLGLSEEDKQ